MNQSDRIVQFEKLMGDIVSEEMIDKLVYDGFFIAPASTKYHGNYEGGLFDHSFAVAKCLQELTERNDLKWADKRSPLLVGMFHDICKIDQYIPRHETVEQPSDDVMKRVFATSIVGYEYNPDTLIKGHGDKSVMLLSEYFKLTMEEIMCIRYHMGAFTDKTEWNDYTRAVHNYANVLWTHQADMMVSHVLGV